MIMIILLIRLLNIVIFITNIAISIINKVELVEEKTSSEQKAFNMIGMIVVMIKIIFIVITKTIIMIKIVLLSLGEKEYEEGPLAGKKLPKPVQLLGFLLTGATVVSIIVIFSSLTWSRIDKDPSLNTFNIFNILS